MYHCSHDDGDEATVFMHQYLLLVGCQLCSVAAGFGFCEHEVIKPGNVKVTTQRLLWLRLSRFKALIICREDVSSVRQLTEKCIFSTRNLNSEEVSLPSHTLVLPN